ncbi:capsule biosynthesis protein [Pontibaca methylaminivorans]|uniref:Capsular polysaccharide transport system permease protein n=1 Tax=Pontibaca methylaminivorans TaxID=515897 RepID=A0A1R3WQG2_9RHOB|nr:capsule biosynthesis protein [Pontibaca methylaminivorans]SIT80061.1 capsular polysaccharide transport system permease protein [Pontibaca methylaminivorans]
MTMKPRVRKFRIRRSGTGADTATPSEAAESAAAVLAEIEALRNEGLTTRQLRMARRVAERHGITAASDLDAVRLLRRQGIDPFAQSNMLELIAPGRGGDGHDDRPSGAGLPVRSGGHDAGALARRERGPEPSAGDGSPAARIREISEIQRDIARRRQRRLRALAARLGVFVALPTFLVGLYFHVFATPMYATKSEFLILQADNAGGEGIGGLLRGTQFATSADSIAVQSYLQSKDAMLRLDRDAGFKAHFAQEQVDPVQRLGAGASNEEAYRLYSRYVKIGFDPTEGVIRMEVTAADPAASTDFSERLISYAEERVNAMSQQKRGDQMQDALDSFEQAQAERRTAQEELVRLQMEGSILDPEGVITGLRAQINEVETMLRERELQVASLLDNPRPNEARLAGAQGDVRRLRETLEQLNARMVDASKGENSLAQLTVRLQMAQADLAARDMVLQSALQQVEQTRMEANRQVRYLTTSVRPVPSEDPTYPRKFEGTILAFLIFAGIYLMISLTASILREQVTS